MAKGADETSSDATFAAMATFIKSDKWTLGHIRKINIVHEIESSGPRVTLIVGAALIDDCLVDALRAASVSQDEKILERCWGDHGSIREFSQRVDLGACFGLYGTMTHGDLGKIRDLRNQAAHKSRQRTFESAVVKGACRDLKLPDWWSERRARNQITDARGRYIATVSLVTDFLMIWANVLRKGERPSARLP